MKRQTVFKAFSLILAKSQIRSKLSRLLVIGVALSFVLGLLAPSSAEAILYSISRDDDQLRVVDPTTAATLSGVTMTLAGNTIFGGNGLAVDPTTGVLWGVIRLSGQSGRELVTINPGTGVATSIGNTGDNFAGLAFDSAGTLYGVTGEFSLSSNPESLFTLSKVNATPTLFMALGNGDDGESIAFNPVNGLMYHGSGWEFNFDGIPEIFEKINLGTMTVTNIPIPKPPLGDEAEALTYSAANGAFFWVDGFFSPRQLFLVSPDGSTATLIGDLDHSSKGLAIVATPEPSTLLLLGISLLGLGLWRRRVG